MNKIIEKKLKFIDLFAGLGGFHFALSDLGCECVFASEIRADLQKLYTVNHPGTPVFGDITKVPVEDIPSHDILCAGFPCQPFSQAGKQQGFGDEKERGNLFNNICDILKCHKPEYVILENVANLKGHDNGNTWDVIYNKLFNELGYWVEAEILSPHQYGIAQHRKRMYIVCRRKKCGTLDDFSFPSIRKFTCNIDSIIDRKTKDIQKVKPETRKQLAVWQEFIDLIIEHNDTIPSFPIWAMEFGATYDYETKPPAYQTATELNGKRGRLGKIINGNTKEECLLYLPNYAQSNTEKYKRKDDPKDFIAPFPKWKIRYIQENRAFYKKHKQWIDKWLKKVQSFDNSHLKLEWNCGPKASSTIEDKIVQFRASGVRVKLPTFSPALNLVGTQIPIFPWVELPEGTYSEGEPSKGRYMTLSEGALIQGMMCLKFGDDEFRLSQTRSFEALGNAVNVTIIKHIAKRLLSND